MKNVKSPGSRTIEGLFEGRPDPYKLFILVRKFIESIGPLQVRVSKTQISFGTKTQFAWVWLPQLWIKKAPQNAIVLSFGLGRRIEHPRISESKEPYPGRWTHHVVIEKESDFDDNVRSWLREAYEFSRARCNRSKSDTL